MTEVEKIAAGQPDYPPVHRTPAWLSHFDVQQAIVAVADSRDDDAWKVCCWQLLRAIDALAAESRQHLQETGNHDR